ncbi:MAG: hypothetical protein H7Z41_12765 [Cytophagales bacterium]|nr:hypothetical protein [Armatimonadota bacterium]
MAVTAITALIGLSTFSLAAPVLAQTIPTPPVVRYAVEGTRQLIFVNNPERLEVGYTDAVPGSVTSGVTYNDLADADQGRKAIQRLTVPAGSYRNLFEHVYNLSRATVPAAAGNPIQYGVSVYNPNRFTVKVTVFGKGFVTGTAGGKPLADVLNAEQAGTPGTVLQVYPGQTVWILRTDTDFATTGPINPGSFFSGTVDFDVLGGVVIVSNLAYQTYSDTLARPPISVPAPFDFFPGLSGPDDMGFITRRYTLTAAPESRVYKGLMSYPKMTGSGSGVTTNLSFSVDDATVAGDLPVTYPQYVRDAVTGEFAPSPTAVIAGTGWFTHNTPLRDTPTVRVVGNDLFDIQQPGFGRVYALFATNAANTPFAQSNLGNWGILYRDAITVTNSGSRDRTFALSLNNSSGSGSPIAYRDEAGVWQNTLVRAVPVTYYSFTVLAGATQTIEGTFTLGCPGVGTLRHAVTVTN